ncbi:MAG: amidohydrolase [Thermodesulfobacteriota bacterium]
MTSELIIENCTLLPRVDRPWIEDAFLRVRGATVDDYGSMAELQVDSSDSVVRVDGKNRLVMPGLINAHNHCAMTLFRGMADDLELTTWLNEHIFPAEAARVNPEMVYHCTKLAAAEMILSGTTSVADGYFFEDKAADAFIDSGMRAVASHGVLDFPAPGVADPKRNVAAVAEFIDRLEGRHPRVQPAVFAHSPYTCSPETLIRARELARDRGVPFFIHLAESQAEQAMIADPRGASPVKHLAALGVLDSNCVCIHCVWLDEEDLELFGNCGGSAVICPQSHLKLASGIAPALEMIERNIRVGLGTDGCASNNSLDMFREMDLFAKTQKAYSEEATALSARQALVAATETNGRILGLEQVGRLEPGWKADVIGINLDQPHLCPCYSQDTLVYAASGSDVDLVIIDGELVMEERRILTFDLDETMAAVRRLM